MNSLTNFHSRRAFVASLAFAASSFLGACGGGGDAGTAAPSSSPPNQSSTPSPEPATNDFDSATFLIGIKLQGPGGPSVMAFGTGFAVDGRLIATNSHVTRGILDSARALAAGGIRVTGVSAFQSETGREYPLLEALVHPSYTGDLRSPDVGLLVARDKLPSQLTLATPEEAGLLRKGDTYQLNGFPADVFNQLVGEGKFQPGLTVPQASLFSGTLQALRNFDERVVVNPPSELTVDYFEHSADTAGGTSGSPIIRNNKVVGVHYAGTYLRVVRPGPNNTLVVDRDGQATAAFGIHVKHLHNLIKEFNTGVLEADKRFRLPPPDALINAGQSPAPVVTEGTYSGSNTLTDLPGATHQITIKVDKDRKITGTAVFPALGSRPELRFLLSGTLEENGKVEFVDNAPQVGNWTLGVYLGNLNTASGKITGKYYSHTQSGTTHTMVYYGDWELSR